MEVGKGSPQSALQAVEHNVDPDGDLMLIMWEFTTSMDTLPDESNPYKAGYETTEALSEALFGESQLEQQEIRIRVSSKQFMAASPVFRAMLQPGFAEGTSLRETGHADLHLCDDDPHLVLFLMNILHGQSSKNPQLDFSMAEDLAILVDKYDVSRASTMVTNCVFESLGVGPFGCTMDQLLSRILVSWVFKMGGEFTESTKAALVRGSEDLVSSNVDVPIPTHVLRKINKERSDLITDVFDRLDTLLIRGQAEIAGSRQSGGCAVMKVEALTSALHSVNLLHPPAPPYSGLSLQSINNGLCKIVTEIRHYNCGSSIVGHDIEPQESGWHKFHNCGFAELANQISWEWCDPKIELQGLELDSN